MARLTMDLRHTSDSQVAALVTRLAEAGDAFDVTTHCERIWDSPAEEFDPANIDSVERAAKNRGYGYKKFQSGAGHDAVNIARIRPTSMIFVPCLHGISHNEAEYTSPEQCTKGAQVLCDAVLEHAGF